MKITKDMLIGDVIRQYPDLVEPFMMQGMMCVGCPSAQGESIEQAALVHGLDVNTLVNALNEALK